ncbi:MAG: hypothetical protein QNL04_10045 [SAR324 cluster bacterium]|nr:hypothetical protein [SAR324 cluster bacterium]
MAREEAKKSEGLKELAKESIEDRQQAQEKREQLVEKAARYEAEGAPLPAADITWLLSNLKHLPSEAAGPNVLPTGFLREKPLGSEALQKQLNIFNGKTAQSASSKQELLALIAAHQPLKLDKIFLGGGKILKSNEKREGSGFWSFFTLETPEDNQAVTILRQKMSSLVHVLLTLNAETKVYDKSVYGPLEAKSFKSKHPYQYEVDSLDGLFELLKALVISTNTQGEDLFRSRLPKKNQFIVKQAQPHFTATERSHNSQKLAKFKESLQGFEMALNKEAGLNQFNLHWLTDTYIRYLHSLKARVIYEIYQIKYAEGTELEKFKTELWKILKLVNYLLTLNNYLKDFKKLTQNLRDPKFRLSIMAGPRTVDIKNALASLKGKNSVAESSTEASSYFVKGMAPEDLLNMVMKHAILLARIPAFKAHALRVAKLFSASSNVQILLMSRRIVATTLETEFKLAIASAGAIRQFQLGALKDDIFDVQISSSELMRNAKERKEQIHLMTNLFKFCAKTIEKYAQNIDITTQAAVDPFRKIIWIIEKTHSLKLMSGDLVRIIDHKGPGYINTLKKNNKFPSETLAVNEKGVAEKVNPYQRFNALANFGLIQIEDLTFHHKQQTQRPKTRETTERSRGAGKRI